MDTPEKTTQFSSPLNQFEDSPIFSYINSLSPIKPVKSVHIFLGSQSSFTFAPLPPVFSQPHIRVHKESKFLKSHNCEEALEGGVSSEVANAVSANDGVAGDVSQLLESLPPILENSDSADCLEADPLESQDDTLDCQNILEENLQRLDKMVKKMESNKCDWEMLDPADPLIFNSPMDPDVFRGLTQKLSSVAEAENPSIHLGETLGLQKTNQIQEDHSPVAGMSDLSDYKTISLHRSMRRCLDFEMQGASSKNLIGSSNSSSSVVVQSNEQLVPDLTRSILSGIGLHLNSLALQLPTTDPHGEYASQQSAHVMPYEPNPRSPKNKRQKLEGEGESCKRCTCKKSKCLKLYCECFAAGVYCIEPCSCQDCFNKPIHEAIVLATRKQIESRNPLAFAPKVVRGTESDVEVREDSSKTPASSRHKRGCNCKKSNCLKKYCECFQGGVGCSSGCRCEGCKNTFGRKDGSALVEPEVGGEDEMEVSEAPRSHFEIGSSSGSYADPLYGMPSITRSQSKQFEASPYEEIPDFLRVNFSPSPGINILSPNSKRVFPPQNNLRSSSGNDHDAL